MPKVTIYSTPTCHYCKDVKEFLNTRGVPFEDHNVAADIDKRKEMISRSGGRMVPVVAIGDQIFVGFDKFKEAIDNNSVVI